MLASLAHDVRCALRLLHRAPGFTAVCLVTMALAVSANSAIFSTVNGVLLKTLPYRDADRIVGSAMQTTEATASAARRPATSTIGKGAPMPSSRWRPSPTPRAFSRGAATPSARSAC